MTPLAALKLTLLLRLAVPPPVLFVAATMFITRLALVCSAALVIALVALVNCRPWLIVTTFAPFEPKLMPFRLENDTSPVRKVVSLTAMP